MELLDDRVFGVQNIRIVLIPLSQNVKIACVVDNCLSQKGHHSAFSHGIIDE